MLLFASHAMSNQHKEVLTLTDLNEILFWHTVCNAVSFSILQRMASELEPVEKLLLQKILSTKTLREINFMSYNLHHLYLIKFSFIQYN